MSQVVVVDKARTEVSVAVVEERQYDGTRFQN
jgi:hypothetical protein